MRTHTHTHTHTNNINICWQLCTTCLQMHCCCYCSNIYNFTNSQFSSFLERARSKFKTEMFLAWPNDVYIISIKQLHEKIYRRQNL